MSHKPYGLFLPKQQKQQQALLQRKPVFDQEALEEDDDEELLMPNRSGPALIQMRSKANNLAKVEIKKALEEDPNAFAYDDVYEDMQSAKEPAGGSRKTEIKKPKYMDNLLKSAELRKREKERRDEKLIQKEREQEGEEFKDKEAFVTTAYKEKLKELRETEARENNEAACEVRLDVRKQQDLSGFYRHLLNQEVGSEKTSLHSSSDRFESPAASSSSRINKSSSDKTAFKKVHKQVQRNLRERNESDPEEEEPEVPGKREQKAEDMVAKPITPSPEEAVVSPATGKNTEQQKKEQEAEPTPLPEPAPKVDRRALVLKVFQKRTVGTVFEEAVKRYQERKQESGV